VFSGYCLYARATDYDVAATKDAALDTLMAKSGFRRNAYFYQVMFRFAR
jgi:hypothetical protein